MDTEIIAQRLAHGTFAGGFIRAAYAPALITHTTAGVVALVSGAAALLFHKGGDLHKIAGRAFVVAMLAVGLTGPLIAKSRVAMLTPLLAAYFVATAWRSAARNQESSQVFELITFALVLGLAAFLFVFGSWAAHSSTGSLDGFPASFHYVLGGFAALAAAFDLKLLLRHRPPSRASTISRHLGRMCLALLMAGTSFFIGQQDRFPEFIRESRLLALIAFAPLAFLLFWLVRVRLVSRARFHPALEMAGRVVCILYVTLVAAGLFGLLRPRGL